MIEYLKTETDALIEAKLPVRVIYKDGDTIHVVWASTPTGDQEKHVSTEVFPETDVVFSVTR